MFMVAFVRIVTAVVAASPGSRFASWAVWGFGCWALVVVCVVRSGEGRGLEAAERLWLALVGKSETPPHFGKQALIDSVLSGALTVLKGSWEGAAFCSVFFASDTGMWSDMTTRVG